MPCIRDNPMVALENLTKDGINKRKVCGRAVLSMWEIFFSSVEPNDLGHRIRVPSRMSPKEPAYGDHKRRWGPTK